MAEVKIDHLRQLGTRYQHWTELLDEFRAGIVVLGKIKETYRSKADEVKEEQLKNAVELIEKQLTRHSDYDKKVWTMGSQINAIPKKAEDILG